MQLQKSVRVATPHTQPSAAVKGRREGQQRSQCRERGGWGVMWRKGQVGGGWRGGLDNRGGGRELGSGDMDEVMGKRRVKSG